MEQIYYTQCPVGYGLGASNGFQIKRMTPGYPTSGDFRHLGLRAFPGGGRALAPPSLRYRRDGEVAEVAWLSPRPNEYETERGLWGRPGGHFAHGVRVSEAELASIRHWPAGLFDAHGWKRTDREPTRGRPPDDLALSPEGLIRPPSFADVAPLAGGEDPDLLARLLTALAFVAAEGRTLFLIDEPANLGPRVQLLTFAFPAPLRADLTFSTYHDRPEELPGYRIQGTIPLARPNRSALTSLGVVADLATGTFEPRIEPAAWAKTLAGWLVRHDPVDEADWSATEARAKAARPPEPPASAWSDDWLGPLFAYPEALRSRSAPGDPEGWAALRAFTDWQRRSGLSADWARVRNPAWWLASAEAGAPIAEGRAALVSHLDLRDAWRAESQQAAWGEAVAAWLRDAGPEDRDEAVAAILRASPRSARPPFARALLRGLTPEGASAVLDRLRADPSSDRGMLLPLEAGAEAAAILGGAELSPLRSIVEEAKATPGATSAVLDAAEAALDDRPESLQAVAAAVSAAFDPDGPDGGREALAWALRRPRASAPLWLGPSFRPLFADPGQSEAWRGLRDRTPEGLRPELARVALEVARDEGLPDEAFRWAVENLLLPLAPRPNDPAWAETYLRRTPSDWKLTRLLFSTGSGKVGVLPWLEQARGRGEVSPEQSARIDNARTLARSLNSKDPESLLKVDISGVGPEERREFLGQMLARVGGAGLEGLPIILGACRGAWPGAFDPGAPGLRALASPLAKCLAALNLDPGRWLDRLGSILDRLGLIGQGGRGFEPDGLAAEILAATSALPGQARWPIRQHLLRDDRAWPILAGDVRRELAGSDVGAVAETLKEWDRNLVQERPERFFAMFLNACDGPRLAAAVLARAADLRSLPTLPWWDHARHPGARDDLRDGYARTAPLRPFEMGTISPVRAWVTAPPGPSAGGLARWRCLEALTNFGNAGTDAEARWPVVLGWKDDVPLGSLAAGDQLRFVAWLLLDLEAAESFQVDHLARWLTDAGFSDPDRLDRWADAIEGLTEVPADVPLFRSRIVADLRSDLRRLARPEKDQRRARPS